MKAFLLAMVAMVVISVAANQILMQSGFSASEAAANDSSVRLSD